MRRCRAPRLLSDSLAGEGVGRGQGEVKSGGPIAGVKPLHDGATNCSGHLTCSIPPWQKPFGGRNVTSFQILGGQSSLLGKEETNRHQKVDGDQGHPDNVPLRPKIQHRRAVETEAISQGRTSWAHSKLAGVVASGKKWADQHHGQGQCFPSSSSCPTSQTWAFLASTKHCSSC